MYLGFERSYQSRSRLRRLLAAILALIIILVLVAFVPHGIETAHTYGRVGPYAPLVYLAPFVALCLIGYASNLK